MTSDRALLGIGAVLFGASLVLTVWWCTAMAQMPAMPMPGSWALSMTWMRMPGQTWPSAIATFLGMWTVMMMAMMLPSLMPMLYRYRRAVGVRAPTARLGRLTMLVGLGYFSVWTLLGAIVFAGGVALAAIALRMPALARTVPLLAGCVAVIAGALQFTSWKAQQLACCRASNCAEVSADARTALRHGLYLGVHCSCCCAGLTAILLIIGVMDLWVMVITTTAITFERFAPDGHRAARGIGIIVLGVGLFLLAQALAMPSSYTG